MLCLTAKSLSDKRALTASDGARCRGAAELVLPPERHASLPTEAPSKFPRLHEMAHEIYFGNQKKIC
jgi:hypothetical protein